MGGMVLKIHFTQDQFQIAIDMSEVEFHSFYFDDQKLFIEASLVNVMYNFSKNEVFISNISYQEWLENKYIKNSETDDRYDYILIDDIVTFVIDEPYVCYEGVQVQFIEEFSKFNLTSNKSPIHTYIFGGIFKNSSYDEFEVFSNSPIEIRVLEINKDVL